MKMVLLNSNFALLQILSLDSRGNEVSNGKMLLHTENSLLSLLSEHPGVIRHYGMFRVSMCLRHPYDVSCVTLMTWVALSL